MSAERLELDELVEHWTLLDGERELVAGKRGTTRLVFALMLKFYGRHGRFPDGDGDLPREVVDFVARQVRVAPADLRRYEFSGRTVEYHRAQIRGHFGFRECTVEDAQAIERWLAERIASRIPAAAADRTEALIAVGDEEDAESGGVLGLIKSAAGNVSLETMLLEIDKLEAVRAIGLPAGLFADVTPRVLAGWRQQAAVESPSHLRRHSRALRLTLLAALLHSRAREITDGLVDLLIQTVHRIGARAEKKVTQELIGELKRVAGKENLLFRVAEASVARPDGMVKDVIFPAVGGEGKLRDLIAEYKSAGPTYRRTVQTKFRSSYSNHYRRGLIRLLGVLEVRSNNRAPRPVLHAPELIARYAATRA